MDGSEAHEPGKRRLNSYGRTMRRGVFSPGCGLAYDEIAREEGVTAERIRQIVSEVLRERKVDAGADHAKLQLARLERVMRLAGEAIARGELRAVSLYLKALDRLDRCRKSPAPSSTMTRRRASVCSPS